MADDAPADQQLFEKVGVTRSQLRDRLVGFSVEMEGVRERRAATHIQAEAVAPPKQKIQDVTTTLAANPLAIIESRVPVGGPAAMSGGGGGGGTTPPTDAVQFNFWEMGTLMKGLVQAYDVTPY